MPGPRRSVPGSRLAPGEAAAPLDQSVNRLHLAPPRTLTCVTADWVCSTGGFRQRRTCGARRSRWAIVGTGRRAPQFSRARSAHSSAQRPAASGSRRGSSRRISAARMARPRSERRRYEPTRLLSIRSAVSCGTPRAGRHRRVPLQAMTPGEGVEQDRRAGSEVTDDVTGRARSAQLPHRAP